MNKTNPALSKKSVVSEMEKISIDKSPHSTEAIEKIIPFEDSPQTTLSNSQIGTESDSVTIQNTASNSQLLADELKKSITISDTIDINKGEPEFSYEEEITEKEEERKTQLFYPRYTPSQELMLDKKLVDYANELKQLLKESPEKKITIIGHTDNIGNAKDNFKIALKKSRQVKWYLTARRGLPRSRIKAISKGEQEPIESNSSNWGRRKNNRIEIFVE